MRRSIWLAAVAVVVAAGGCRGSDAPPPTPRASPAPRRVLGPAPGGVRPLPPHAIRGDGVGPYRLGRSLGEILGDLPSGPSIATLDIPGVVGCSVVRAEEGAVLIDGESQGEASFLAVVRPDIARTESGIAVGSSRSDLEAAVGPALVDHAHARDPRLYVGRVLPTVRFLVEQDRVAAVMIARNGSGAAAPTPGGKAPAPPPDAGVDEVAVDCGAPAIADAVALVGPKAGVPVTATAWCAGDGAGMTAVASGDTITLVGTSGADGHAHKIGAIDAPGVVFVATIADDDGDDLVEISERGGGDARVVALTLYRWEAAHLVRVADQDLYRLAASSARWIGARLEDIEVLVELEAHGEAVIATGAMVSRAGGEIRDVAPLVPVVVGRRRRAAASDGGDLDAGHPVIDDAHR